MTGLFQRKTREELAERIEKLQTEIGLYIENRKYALQAQKEIDDLKVTSEKVGHQIEKLQMVYDSEVKEYRYLESTVSDEDTLRVRHERVVLRPGIEKEVKTEGNGIKFRLEADKVDKKLRCGASDLACNCNPEFVFETKLKVQTI